MNYELAKELKDAGWPQERTSDGGHWAHRENRELNEEGCYAPTLSELIEACGEDFIELEKGKGSWYVKGRWKRVARDCHVPMYDLTGSTPEEAVAKLYIALNKEEGDLSTK